MKTYITTLLAVLLFASTATAIPPKDAPVASPWDEAGERSPAEDVAYEPEVTVEPEAVEEPVPSILPSPPVVVPAPVVTAAPAPAPAPAPAVPKATFKAFSPFDADTWDDFDPTDRVIESLTKRVSALEASQLKEEDVIRIVERNFSVLRIRRTVGGKSEEIAVTNDVVEEQHTVPGFSGTFSVPKGGRVESVTVWENGVLVEKSVTAMNAAPVAFSGGVMYRGVADNYSVYATNAAVANVPDGGFRVTTYETPQLQEYLPEVQNSSPQQKQRFFQRLLSPAMSRRGSTCQRQADGSWSCN